jgi:hypothetical protein
MSLVISSMDVRSWHFSGKIISLNLSLLIGVKRSSV